jgi:hypothetical protein
MMQDLWTGLQIVFLPRSGGSTEKTDSNTAPPMGGDQCWSRLWEKEQPNPIIDIVRLSSEDVNYLSQF